MASGGARARSGPPPDPSSGRSDRRGLSFLVLPAGGYDGDVPEFPLPPSVTGDLTGDREVALWESSWRLPQGYAWSLESWRWEQVAMYCRLKAIIEVNPSASAALVTQLIRIEDRVGLSDDGLKRNGWQIAADTKPVVKPSGKSTAGGGSRARLGVIRGGAS